VSTANGHRWLTSAGLSAADNVFASLDEKTLQQLNARIAVEGQDAKRVAADYLQQ
jgi:glycine betaine/choline ABC-type transport system substrate-binding protein